MSDPEARTDEALKDERLVDSERLARIALALHTAMESMRDALATMTDVSDQLDALHGEVGDMKDQTKTGRQRHGPA